MASLMYGRWGISNRYVKSSATQIKRALVFLFKGWTMKKLVLNTVLSCLLVGANSAIAAGVLNIYNWSDYVDEGTVKEFEKNNAVKVRYDVYDSNETLEGKVLTGRSGYDLVAPSNSFVGRQIKAGAYQPIDKKKIPNYKNIDPNLLKLLTTVDPGNKYAVPYFWGINTLAINTDKVTKALGGKLPDNQWDLIFNPAYAKKLQSCGISVLDSPAEMFPITLNYMKRNPQSSNINDIKAAADVLKKVRPYIKRFSSSGYIDDLARGDLCVVVGYGGDLNIAKRRAVEAKNGVKIQVLVPKEGVGIWVDSFMIPKDAKNVDNALKYINNSLDPKVAARNGNVVTYSPASKPARALMKKEYTSDRSIFLGDADVKAGFMMTPMDPATLRQATRLYQGIKTSK